MRALSFLITALLVSAPGGAAAADPPTVSEQVAELRPKAEAWQRIPWRSDLALARREAAQERKPLFVWAMNGDPLGCT